MDDRTFIGSRFALLSLLSCFAHSGPSFGLHINLSKCELYWPSGDCSFPGFPHTIKRIDPVSSGLELLGSPVWGPPQFFDSFLSTKLDKTSSIQEKLAELGDPLVELYLLRSCFSVCKISHFTLCVFSLGCFPSLFDSNLCNCLSRIMCCSISDSAWFQATLPFCMGGLGLHGLQRSSHPYFLGSLNSARVLVSCLKETFDATLSMPGEDSALFYFENISISTSSVSSQCELQASLDNQLFSQIFNTSNIRDQARLRAVSHSSGTSSGWLKAIPQPSLGLALSSHDFVIALRLWLGVPLFPLTPLCT